MNYKNMVGLMCGCPSPEIEGCSPSGIKCRKCRKDMLTGFVRDSCSGIVQTSTLEKIAAKAEKLLETE